MSNIARFGQYAAAFEEVFKNDDWSILEPYFTEDAVYEVKADPPLGGRQEGRDAIFSGLKQALDTFDRLFDDRVLELVDGPEVRDGAVWISWKGTYKLAGAPDFVMAGEEIARFEGDRISYLEDEFPEGAGEQFAAYMEAYGDKLLSD